MTASLEASVARSGAPRLPYSGPRVALARCRGTTSPAGGWPPRPGCSVQPRPSPQAALRAGTSAASTRRDRPQSGQPCAFRERKPAHLRLKWASNPFGRRRFASCECCNLSEVRLGEGQPVAALSVDSRGLSHEPARGKWMVRPNRRRFWRAQPSRTPPPRYGARRERATARLDRHCCERFQIRR